ncbi:MAG TPA: 5'-nucleotidase, lipoprotein e(P4) family [Ohtaekwangia sp.]
MKSLLFIVAICTISPLYGQNTTGCDNKLLPVLWVQQSGEYKALCYQAYNAAQWRLESLKKDKKDKRPLAIITDVDETILDNSYYEAQRTRECSPFTSASWKQWTARASATAVPGAVEFFQYAKKKGITIFYISNRNVSEVPGTLKNLLQLGFPDADTTHMLFLTDTSSKEQRRQKIAQQFNVVMLVGDNLNDFSAVFESRSNRERQSSTDQLRTQWGNKFIMLPNPLYGDWENALYNFKRLDAQQKQDTLRQQLQGIR